MNRSSSLIGRTYLATLVGLLPVPSLAQQGLRDGPVRSLLTTAIEEYRALRVEQSMERLQIADRACRNDGCSPQVAARVYMTIGTVQIGGQHDIDAGVQSMRLAIERDARVEPDASLTTPEISAAFERARGRRTERPTGGPTPTESVDPDASEVSAAAPQWYCGAHSIVESCFPTEEECIQVVASNAEVATTVRATGCRRAITYCLLWNYGRINCYSSRETCERYRSEAPPPGTSVSVSECLTQEELAVRRLAPRVDRQAQGRRSPSDAPATSTARDVEAPPQAQPSTDFWCFGAHANGRGVSLCQSDQATCDIERREFAGVADTVGECQPRRVAHCFTVNGGEGASRHCHMTQADCTTFRQVALRRGEEEVSACRAARSPSAAPDLPEETGSRWYCMSEQIPVFARRRGERPRIVRYFNATACSEVASSSPLGGPFYLRPQLHVWCVEGRCLATRAQCYQYRTLSGSRGACVRDDQRREGEP